jgi:exosortase
MKTHSRNFRFLVPALLIAAIFLWSYLPTLIDLVGTWKSDPDYQHGMFVIPLAMAIAWRRKDLLPAMRQASVYGASLIVLAAIMRWFAARLYFVEIDSWSILVWLAGVVWLAAGWKTMVWSAPAIGFLWFMTPLPDRVELALSLPLQHLAAAGSAWVLQLLGQPAVLDGTTVLFGSEILDIHRTCAGLRMFFGTFAMALALSLLMGLKAGRTAVLLAMAIPTAIMVNIFRIVTTAFLYQWTSDVVARRFEHDFAGLLMNGLALCAFFLIAWVTIRLERAASGRPHSFARRLALWPAMGICLLAMIFFWHRSQLAKANSRVTRMAESTERAAQFHVAARYWEIAMRLNPNDVRSRKHLASALLSTSRAAHMKDRALSLLADACRLDPWDLEAARQRLELAVELRDFVEVTATASAILYPGPPGNLARAKRRAVSTGHSLQDQRDVRRIVVLDVIRPAQLERDGKDLGRRRPKGLSVSSACISSGDRLSHSTREPLVTGARTNRRPPDRRHGREKCRQPGSVARSLPISQTIHLGYGAACPEGIDRC